MDWRKCYVLLAAGVMGTAWAESPPIVVVKSKTSQQSATLSSPATPTAMPARFEFMGIEVGAPVVPECPTEQIPYAGPVYEFKTASGACWTASGMRPTNRTDVVNNDSLSIMPLANKRPTGTRRVTAIVVNGQIEGLEVETDGYVHAQDLFEQLKQKLGTPTLQDEIQVTTGVGAKFSSPRALWSLPAAHIKFNGIVGTVDSGLIVVRTPAEQEREDARQKQRAKTF